MPRHRRPPRIVGLAVADGMLLCAAGLAIVGSHVAPHPSAAERFTTALEASEPVAHGGPIGATPSEALDQVLQRASSAPVQTRTENALTGHSGRSTTTESQWTTPPRQQPSSTQRSEERRVGKECRSRWSPDD